VKQIQVTLPYDKTEAVLDFLLDVMGVKNLVKFNTDNAHLLQFRVGDDLLTETIEKLKGRGLGVEYGLIDVLDLRASLPREETDTKEKITQRDALTVVEEIHEKVKAGACLSFDFFAFVILAATIAGFGLIQNNGMVILAAMLLSPLMGPMLGVALGYVVADRKLFMMGTKNELVALIMSVAVGAVLGGVVMAAASGFAGQLSDDLNLGTVTEMTRRNGFLWLDLGVAIFSGAAVAVSITRGDISALVGVAISASLVPPAANVGICLALGAAGYANIALLALGSLQLLAMNVVAVDLAAIVMFKVKKLSPIKDRSVAWTAVTAYKKSRSSSLYHHPEPASTPAEPQPGKSTSAETNKNESKT
jgi:uncharacterized hydrophobic protein (TIGR00341 family)